MGNDQAETVPIGVGLEDGHHLGGGSDATADGNGLLWTVAAGTHISNEGGAASCDTTPGVDTVMSVGESGTLLVKPAHVPGTGLGAKLASVFPQRYSFVSESGNQTTFVASASPERVGVYEMRNNARIIADRFDFDMHGLCARYYMRTDWDTEASVLTDDFKPENLETAAQRHNTTCIAGCAYPAD